MHRLLPWSRYQNAIFAEVAGGKGHTHVDALAGSGKTSTILESLYHVKPGASSLLCAFNKVVQDKLRADAPKASDVKTLHALGRATCMRHFRGIALEQYKVYEIIKTFSSMKQLDHANLVRAVSLCKYNLVDPTVDIKANYELISNILFKHDISTAPPSDPLSIDEDLRKHFVVCVLNLLRASRNNTKYMDFDDMVWLPVVYGLEPFKRYDNVFVDEAQDLNLNQIELALRCVSPEGRIISVGDEHQAIYGFMGAHADAIETLTTRLSSQRLPLKITYRCAKQIVHLAKQFVPSLEAAPGAEEGKVTTGLSLADLRAKVQKGDFVVSRTNAPLLKLCLELQTRGTEAKILGRDWGTALINDIARCPHRDRNGFLDWVNDKEQRALSQIPQTQDTDGPIGGSRNLNASFQRMAEELKDKMNCLRMIAAACVTVAEIKLKLAQLFVDGGAKDSYVILATTHKVKGLEANRVFVLMDTFGLHTQEEKNLVYVAVTRARTELLLVNSN